jgi:NADPH-dependent 2,4-dienoyl-CoA reductase/sulfur reductase-like enzyme
MKVIIVGGVAGGASCAARLRRLDEKAEILMVERGPYVSYANCGLPYHISGVIEKESSRLGELPRDREIHVICRSAQRAYYATRILAQNGFKAKNISGGTPSRAMRSIAEAK